MKRKEKEFRVIDKNEGIGIYEMKGKEEGKKGEWDGGIERIMKEVEKGKVEKKVMEMMKKYIDEV